MDTDGIRKRVSEAAPNPPDLGAGVSGKSQEPHPAGDIRHAPWLQVVRAMGMVTWFVSASVATFLTQLIGTPLYILNQDYYYAYMATTKQSFGIFLITLTHWFSPSVVRVSWDSSLRGQFKKTADGRLETSFPERLVLITNHQVYTDWLYLWWIAYTSRMHGHIYIILKESLRYVPILGPGMMFYGFIFMARKWTSDKPRLEHRLKKLQTKHHGPMTGQTNYDPMWLMIFPEGTNLSANTRKRSVAWSQKSGIPDMKHQLLPRSTGLYFCLQQLKDTVDWIYDCTAAYEGTPVGGYAQDYFTLRSTYLQGRPPKSVNMHWRRFKISEIPLDDQPAFEAWIDSRWREKDELLQQFYDTGRFPADKSDPMAKAGETADESGFIETELQFKNWFEVGQIYIVLGTVALLANIVSQLSKILVHFQK